MTVEVPDYQPPNSSSLQFADTFTAEDEILSEARMQGQALGCNTVSVGTGALLSFLASAVNAKHVVEVGTGSGVATLSLLRGMADDGVLTSIDVEVDHQRVARDTLTKAKVAQSKFRLIAGRAPDVLPRLTDAAYDLLLVNTDTSEYGLFLQQALRLLKSGGIVAFTNALLDDKIADPAERDEATVALRDLERQVQEDERLRSVLVPAGDGMLLAVVR